MCFRPSCCSYFLSLKNHRTLHQDRRYPHLAEILSSKLQSAQALWVCHPLHLPYGQHSSPSRDQSCPKSVFPASLKGSKCSSFQRIKRLGKSTVDNVGESPLPAKREAGSKEAHPAPALGGLLPVPAIFSLRAEAAELALTQATWLLRVSSSYYFFLPV